MEPAAAGAVLAIVRVVLLGGLSAVLAAQVAVGLMMVAGRGRHAPAPAEEEGEHEPERPEPRPFPRFAAPDPAPPPPCAARPGHACLRGRMVLRGDVLAAWRDAIASDEQAAAVAVAAAAAASQDGEDSGDDAGDERGDEADQTVAPSAKAPRPSLPPEGSFADSFALMAMARENEEGSPACGDGGREGTISADGSFEIHLPPGRYDLVAKSNDGRLLAGIEGLRAEAGEALGGIDLVLARPVEVAGRVMDDRGVAVAAVVEIVHAGGCATFGQRVPDHGRFSFSELWPGTYLLKVSETGYESPPDIEVRAPVQALELRLARLPAALLMVGPGASLEASPCPRGSLSLTDATGRRQRASFRSCVAELGGMTPGSSWRVHGKLGGRAYDRWITFGGGAPLAPVCLDSFCGPETVVVHVTVADSAGALAMAELDVLPADGRGAVESQLSHGFTARMEPGRPITLRARVPGQEVTSTFWPLPGVNDLLLRLPGKI
jgi:hypothetical protein